MKKDLVSYVFVAAGLAALGVGIRMVSGGDAAGWVGIGMGIPLTIIAYFLMRPPPSLEEGDQGQRRLRRVATRIDGEGSGRLYRPPHRRR